jgi:hypothetical protein
VWPMCTGNCGSNVPFSIKSWLFQGKKGMQFAIISFV